MSMLPAGKTARAQHADEEAAAPKRHRTRGAVSKRALTADTVLFFAEGPLSSDDEDDEEEAGTGSAAAGGGGVGGGEEEGGRGKGKGKGTRRGEEPVYRPAASSIEIPVIRMLTDEEMRSGGEPAPEGTPLELTTDEWYRKLHLVFEIKEQAFREQAMRSGGSSLRRLVNRSGPVSSTELLLAPEIEAKLSKEDQRMVLGKVDLPEVPEERLRAIEGKLEEVEKSYENTTTHFSRYYLHTQWAPEIKIEKPPEVPLVEGQPPPKPKLMLKLKRLQDKR